MSMLVTCDSHQPCRMAPLEHVNMATKEGTYVLFAVDV
jgi:hypothetical protein